MDKDIIMDIYWLLTNLYILSPLKVLGQNLPTLHLKLILQSEMTTV